MMHTSSLQHLGKQQLLRDFSNMVDQDRRDTATMLAYVAEIDRRKLYLEHACASMFAFCTERFHMSEAIAAKRIRAGRAACRFPCILRMIERGELHLSGVHQLAGHLTDDNHEEVLGRAKHKSMREIERLIAEISPKPDVRSTIRALPIKRGEIASTDPQEGMQLGPTEKEKFLKESQRAGSRLQVNQMTATSRKAESRAVPLSPRRYKLQVTIGQEAKDKLGELQALLSHQIPDGDPAEILGAGIGCVADRNQEEEGGGDREAASGTEEE